jgi:hypothetical protein
VLRRVVMGLAVALGMIAMLVPSAMAQTADVVPAVHDVG